MVARKQKEYLIFIDTNIYLDFYRARDKNFETNMLVLIEANKDRIITTDQIFMEYKKNRQKVIVDTLKKIKQPDINICPPAFLSDTKCIEMINSLKKEITKQSDRLKMRVIEVLNDPVKKDDLYKFLQRLFKDKGEYHLGRHNKLRFTIRNKAKKRFILGYPPRKDSDITIGDSINWEWIVYCAEKSDKNIIIVSRDGDYGVCYDDKLILNDWLSQEFKERINQQRQICLTNRLSEAFKLANIKISKEDEDEENQFIKELNTIEF